MDFKYITDMNHLFSDDPKAEMPDELLEFRDYLGHIIGSATVTNEVEFQSGIPCRKKVSRKSCQGFIKVMKQSIPEPFLYWHCSTCEDGGRIANWRGCCFDQNQYPKHPEQSDDPNPPVEANITREQMKALLGGGLYDPDSERIIYSARPVGQSVILRGLFSDMDNFEGFLASDCNHEENKNRQRLMDIVHESVFDAIQKVYDEHDLGAE